MTDNEIIKALECCAKSGCKNCPENCGPAMCLKNLVIDSVDLINRQKAEIERLQALTENGASAIDTNNRLVQKFAEIEYEARKKFAERLKDEMRLEDDCRYDCMNCLYECKGYVPLIDNLVKEMTEENEK